MDLPATAFLPVESHPVSESPPQTERDRLRRKLRGYVVGGLCKETGDPHATLGYTKRRYAKATVIEYERKLVGWPKNIPFRDFNAIRGGNAVLRMLIHRWKVGKLRFERATPEDIELAKRNPGAVLPGATKKKPGPAGLRDVGEPSELSSTSPSTAALAEPPRNQRTDSKKPRGRDLTGPYVRENPLPKEGIKSKPYILDSDIEDDFGQPGAECGDFWLVEEPIAALGPAATGGLFGFFAYSPSTSHGRTSGTMRLWGSGGTGVAGSEAAEGSAGSE